MIGFVAPVECDGVGGEFGDGLGIVQDDVAPEHHAMISRGDEAVNLLKEIEIDSGDADAVAFEFAAAVADVEGFVAADVKKFAGKVWQKLIVQIFKQFKTFWI